MVRRTVLIGLVAAVLGIAAIPAVSYSAGTRRVHDCPKGQAWERHECVKASVPQAASATIIVHVYDEGGPSEGGCSGTNCPVEDKALYVGKLGPNGQIVASFDSASHTIRVAPGEYLVVLREHEESRGGRGQRESTALFERAGWGKTVSLGTGQTTEVDLFIQIK